MLLRNNYVYNNKYQTCSGVNPWGTQVKPWRDETAVRSSTAVAEGSRVAQAEAAACAPTRQLAACANPPPPPPDLW